MCISKKEVRPGVNGILDYVDVVNSVKSKVVPILDLILELPDSHDGKSNFSDHNIESVLTVVRDILEEAWSANDGVYAIYKEMKEPIKEENKP